MEQAEKELRELSPKQKNLQLMLKMEKTLGCEFMETFIKTEKALSDEKQQERRVHVSKHTHTHCSLFKSCFAHRVCLCAQIYPLVR